ncbi:unnamed protein product (macronuclear) [Paramecium tetraurelia]|uniref:GDT1 family protein n=1 Tax=Paramecium tetraurelia TaxID=5888 RepID=A0E0U1_PARTE|nr:uncharacterized protein GSPATT00022076001 [Paramecium tetraurelia]CAK88908.1 unnamed protein product [Paramecium tetraurelia]|eukprot:XP_001456305.1 hypothetical protein (macronuclear) [Paramecium tetraurelia strain d4-2]
MKCHTITLFFILITEALCFDGNDKILLSLSQSFCSIIVTELGDKTFFLAAIMSIKYNRIAVLIGSTLALILITIISTIFGLVIPELISILYAQVLVSIVFYGFGVKFLYAWYTMQKEKEELQEVEQELTTLDKKLMNLPDPETDQVNDNVTKSKHPHYLTIDFIQAFTLTLLGEWGDKSQITTISLTAIYNPFYIFLGAIMAHFFCTVIAVHGGKLIANQVSEKNFNFLGGIAFLSIAFINTYMALFL